jgi:hypothetical protein
MPVRKFRSAEEMNRPLWREPGDPELYRAMRALWARAARTSRKRFRPGVYRFRSIEEMQDFAPQLEIELPQD